MNLAAGRDEDLDQVSVEATDRPFIAASCSYVAIAVILASVAVAGWHRLSDISSVAYVLSALAAALSIMAYASCPRRLTRSYRGFIVFLSLSFTTFTLLLLRVTFQGVGLPTNIAIRRCLFLLLPVLALSSAAISASTDEKVRDRLSRIGLAASIAIVAVAFDNWIAGSFSWTITGAHRYASGFHIYGSLAALSLVWLAGQRTRVAVAFLCFLGTCAMSPQRSVFLSVCLFFLLVATRVFERRRTDDPRVLLRTGVAIIACAGLLFLSYLIKDNIHSYFEAQMTGVPIAEDANVSFRLGAWHHQLSQLQTSPIFGVGAGGFLSTVGSDGNLREVDSHNSPLTVLWRIGIPLGLLFLLCTLVPAVRCFILRGGSSNCVIFSALVLTGFVFSLANVVLELPYVAGPFWMSYGLMIQSSRIHNDLFQSTPNGLLNGNTDDSAVVRRTKRSLVTQPPEGLS